MKISLNNILQLQGPNLERKIALQKSPSIASKIATTCKNIFGFCEAFCEFAEGIYETCERNFFNLALTSCFSRVQFILFLHFASNN